MKNSESTQSAGEPTAPAPETALILPVANGVVDEERIRLRAYELYCERRGEGGDAIGDWLRAAHEQYDTLPGVAHAMPTSETPSAVGAS